MLKNFSLPHLNNTLNGEGGKKNALKNAEKELRGLEEKTTNINVVCKNINDILSSFGFNNFKLQALDNNSYKLIRPNDNSNASNTLSEGEKN